MSIRWHHFLPVLLMAGCSSLNYQAHSTHDTVPVVAVVNPADRVPPPHRKVTRCSPYDPPQWHKAPPVPTFTPAEEIDPNRLNTRLVKYIESLRAYIAITHRQHIEAYHRYVASCNE